MNRISALVVCVALGMSVPALAQTTEAPANGATTEAPATGVATEQGAAGAAGDAANWEEFNAGLQELAKSDVFDISADSEIEVIPVSERDDEGEATRDDYTVSLPADSADIGALHELLAGNSAITGEVEQAGFAVEDVESIWINANGDIIIYINDGEASEPAANPA